MNPLLHAKDLLKAHGGETVFQSVSFGIYSGQHLAVLGPSGCGKSTLLRLLAGLDVPTQGELRLEGRVISEAQRIIVPPHERRMSMVFQDLALWPALSALENVILGMAALKLPRALKRAQALEVLKICRIESYAARKPAALSIGQQQRVALARALAVRPKLLLLDEPFSGLDVILKQQLFEEITQLATQFGATLVLVSHDPVEALALCSQAVVLEENRCREQGPLKELLQNPASRTLQAFVRHLPGHGKIN